MTWRVFWEGKSLAVGTHWTFVESLYDHRTVHAFQYKIAGDGNVTITPFTSITQQNWVSNGAKLSAGTKTSGPDSDGIDAVPLSLKPAEFIKFKVVVASDTVTLTLEFTQK